MGMLSLLVGVLLFFPAALAILAEREQTHPGPSLRLPAGLLLRIHDASMRRRLVVLGVLAVGSAGMLAATSRVRVATDLRSIRGEDPASEAMERVLAPFGPSFSAETLVVIHGGRSETAAAAPEGERGGSRPPPRSRRPAGSGSPRAASRGATATLR
jgi:predicted RND superfamily exporter protein